MWAAAPARTPTQPQTQPKSLVELLAPRFRFVRNLGRGEFGLVKLFQCADDGRNYAVKFIPRPVDMNVAREVQNHRALYGCANIVCFKEAIALPTHLAVVMEYLAGGELFERVRAQQLKAREQMVRQQEQQQRNPPADQHGNQRRAMLALGRRPTPPPPPAPAPSSADAQQATLSEDESCWFFSHILNALAAIHESSLCHRDLKLENLLLTNDPNSLPWQLCQVKVCDFGYSKDEVVSKAKSRVGTAVYVAPEVVLNNPNAGEKYDGKKADMWSSGVVLYTLLFGRYPFHSAASDQQAVINQIVSYGRGQTGFPFPPATPKPWQNLSAEARDLLQLLLHPNASNRPSAREALTHPWLMRAARVRASLDARRAQLGQAVEATESGVGAMQRAEDTNAALNIAMTPPEHSSKAAGGAAAFASDGMFMEG